MIFMNDFEDYKILVDNRFNRLNYYSISNTS